MQTDLPDDHLLPEPAPPVTVKAIEPADLISYIHHTLGFAPRNSLTAISLAGRNLGAVLRCDWDPHGRTSWQEHSAYARRFAGHLTADHRADGSIVFLFRDPVDHTAAGIPANRPLRLVSGDRFVADPTNDADRLLAAALERELAEAGLPLAEAWLVAEGHVWHLGCPNPPSCAAHGSPASLAETSVLNAALILEGSVVEQEPQDSGLPAAAPFWSAELAAAMRDLVEAADTGDGVDRSIRSMQWFRAWDRVLSGGRVPADPEERAFLLAGLAVVEWRDCLLAAASFTMELAVSGAAWLGGVPEELADNLGTGPREVNAVLYSSVILARTRRAPDWQRIARLRRACTELLPDAVGTVASAVRCIVAWVEWARGRGSTAGRIVAECREEDPEYSLGQLLGEIIDRGVLSEWAGRRETAWSSRGRRAR